MDTDIHFTYIHYLSHKTKGIFSALASQWWPPGAQRWPAAICGYRLDVKLTLPGSHNVCFFPGRVQVKRNHVLVVLQVIQRNPIVIYFEVSGVCLWPEHVACHFYAISCFISTWYVFTVILGILFMRFGSWPVYQEQAAVPAQHC